MAYSFVGLVGAATPTIGELAFDVLVALSAMPALVRVRARCLAVQELPQQSLSALSVVVDGHPNLAYIGRQFANAARQKFTANQGCDALRFQITAYQVRFGGVARGVQQFHGIIFARLRQGA